MARVVVCLPLTLLHSTCIRKSRIKVLEGPVPNVNGGPARVLPSLPSLYIPTPRGHPFKAGVCSLGVYTLFLHDFLNGLEAGTV